ncbi:reverse transcriptase family protein [Thalassolituus maritimus]
MYKTVEGIAVNNEIEPYKSISELESLALDSNYRVFFLEKPNGKKREIQAPSLGLDIVQTRIASLLVRVAMPDYVHSGVKGRSNVTNAKVHVGDHPVLTMDIRNFYPSISKKSIYHFFHKTMNAAPDVAGILAELCSYQDHIPTGSRLSMPLSFWANHSMYSDLQTLCESRDVTMSSYVDDLTFSGKSVNELFQRSVSRIVQDAGLIIHPDKTRLFRRNEAKLITGVIVRADRIDVRNKHHKAIYTLFNEMRSAVNDEELKAIHEELLGRLNAAGQINPAFKQRARNLITQI